MTLKCEACGPECKGHDEVFLHGRCHIGATTWVKYITSTQTLLVLCAECQSLVAQFNNVGLPS
jgi:uncharacterized Zn finger protein